MRAIQFLFVCIFLFASSNLLAAKQPKIAVCHVSGNGDINLLEVSANSNHLGNSKHKFEGITDYAPDEVGASGVGSEDLDGDGVDEGCEPPEGIACPCWDEADLESVTADNQNYGASCDEGAVSFLPFAARIENVPESTPDADGSYTAADFSPGLEPFCHLRDLQSTIQIISQEEAASCIEQIVHRCAAIGTPIPPPAE